MMLYIGENESVPVSAILAVMPAAEGLPYSAIILMADGRTLHSTVTATTLRKRLQQDIFCKGLSASIAAKR